MWSVFEGIVCLHYAYHFCPTDTVITKMQPAGRTQPSNVIG